MLKDYRSRVVSTYDFLSSVLAAVNQDPQSLLKAVREADEETIAKGRAYDAARKYHSILSSPTSRGHIS